MIFGMIADVAFFYCFDLGHFYDNSLAIHNSSNQDVKDLYIPGYTVAIILQQI